MKSHDYRQLEKESIPRSGTVNKEDFLKVLIDFLRSHHTGADSNKAGARSALNGEPNLPIGRSGEMSTDPVVWAVFLALEAQRITIVDQFDGNHFWRLFDSWEQVLSYSLVIEKSDTSENGISICLRDSLGNDIFPKNKQWVIKSSQFSNDLTEDTLRLKFWELNRNNTKLLEELQKTEYTDDDVNCFAFIGVCTPINLFSKKYLNMLPPKRKDSEILLPETLYLRTKDLVEQILQILEANPKVATKDVYTKLKTNKIFKPLSERSPTEAQAQHTSQIQAAKAVVPAKNEKPSVPKDPTSEAQLAAALEKIRILEEQLAAAKKNQVISNPSAQTPSKGQRVIRRSYSSAAAGGGGGAAGAGRGGR